MTWSPEVEAAISRRIAALDDDPWFLSLDDEGRCEAMTIAAMLALHDAEKPRTAVTDEPAEVERRDR